MISKDAMSWRFLFPLLLLCGLGAKHVTPNFEVEAPTNAIAERVAITAEHYRQELAIEWLGIALPNWSQRCQVHVKVGQIGAGGATTFSFGGGHVYGWDMTVQGSLERILDSVIPHEVSHTIFACHFRRPLPRWADEGAATLSEEDSEQRRQQKMAEEVLPTTRRIPLRELLQITEYPKNMQHVLTLYAEGYSLVDYLVQKGGKKRFLDFVQDAHESGWDAAFRKHYEESNVEAIEKKWSRWVIAGSPSLRLADNTLLAAASTSSRDSNAVEQAASIVRSQSPDSKPTETKTKTKDVKFNVPVAGGHTVAPRVESVSAPEPRRRNREIEESKSQPNEVVHSDSPSLFSPSKDQRRPRAPFLSHPELRQLASSPSSQDSADDAGRSQVPHPSPFAPILSTASDRPIEPRDRLAPSDLAPTSLRQAARSQGNRERPVERSSQTGTPVKPVFDRESTLRFKPFSSK